MIEYAFTFSMEALNGRENSLLISCHSVAFYIVMVVMSFVVSACVQWVMSEK